MYFYKDQTWLKEHPKLNAICQILDSDGNRNYNQRNALSGLKHMFYSVTAMNKNVKRKCVSKAAGG